MSPALPLAALGLIDAAFSGFRAYAGRDARIRKHRATIRAALRGLAVSSALLLAPALPSFAAPPATCFPSPPTPPRSCSPSPRTSCCRSAPAPWQWSSASAP
jgi:hypothetical protein